MTAGVILVGSRPASPAPARLTTHVLVRALVDASQFDGQQELLDQIGHTGAPPLMRPIQYPTWQTFSGKLRGGRKQTLHWIREALLLPLAPQSTVIAMSSGAAHFGSLLSGGYAAAKAAIRFICGNAADESSGAGLDIRFVSVLPKLTPATDLGAVAAAAYARRYGIDIDEYVRQQDPPSNPSRLPRHVVDLASSTDPAPGAYLLTPDGLSLLP